MGRVRGGEPRSAGITRIFPDLHDDLLLDLFHKGARAQWIASDLDWSLPARLSPSRAAALARLLSPIYLGEQTAMLGASRILPEVVAAGETTAQLYLSSFVMDEARHFETLTRLYRTLGQQPTRLRDMPDLLRYHHRLRLGDRLSWVWGILISDLIAKHFFRAFGQAQPDALGQLAGRVLQDESRHLAFAEHYLRRNLPKLDAERRRELIVMRDDLYRVIDRMTERMRADGAEFGVDADVYLERLRTDFEFFGKRIGLEAPDLPRGIPRVTASAVAQCFGCLLLLVCRA